MPHELLQMLWFDKKVYLAYTVFNGCKFGTSELLSVLNFRLKIEIKDWEEIAEKDIEMLYNLSLF